MFSLENMKGLGMIRGLFVFCLYISASGPTHAASEFILERPLVFKSALVSAIQIQCQRHFEDAIGTSRAMDCLRAAGALIKYLDQSTFCSDHKKDSCGVVVFRKELLKLTSDVRVFNFLRELNEQFGHLHFLPDFRMDLWQLAVRFAGSEDEAIHWLAVLFQDTANTRFHLRWLAKQRLNRVQRVILGELGEAHHTFRNVYYRENERRLTVFPFTEDMGRTGPYHFYVVAKLRLLMKDEFDDELSRLVPYLFNYVYEVKSNSPRPFRDLLMAEQSELDLGTLNDIRAGELGAQW